MPIKPLPPVQAQLHRSRWPFLLSYFLPLCSSPTRVAQLLPTPPPHQQQQQLPLHHTSTLNPRRVYDNTREPLSITTTTINFKRFIVKSGLVFWFLDQVEEVVMWRKGWKVTGVWMASYAFLCALNLCSYAPNNISYIELGYFPRLILLIPHTILLAIILSTHPSTSPQPPTTTTTTSQQQQQQPTQAPPPENSIAR